MTYEEAFEIAITDSINTFVREVLNARGLLLAGAMDKITSEEILNLKYALAKDLANKWAKKMRIENT